MLISPALFLSWASRLSRCFLSVDCLWPLVQGMLSPAISPRCINNNSNYSHSNQSVAPASRGLSREQIDRHLKSHIDCVAKKNTHTHTNTLLDGSEGDGRTDSEFRRENRCEWVRLVEKTSEIVSGQPFMGVLLFHYWQVLIPEYMHEQEAYSEEVLFCLVFQKQMILSNWQATTEKLCRHSRLNAYKELPSKQWWCGGVLKWGKVFFHFFLYINQM